MTTMMKKSLFPLAGLLVLAVGCAQERPPINRVQPNYFDKSFFIGKDYTSAGDDPEFYSRATLVDVGYGAGQDGLFTSTYAQPVTRVKWQVTENLLIARLSYERISNSDGKGAGKATNDGIVVAAYPIQKHFDIERTYNPSTGEQLNVLEENAIDRPWFQRQFMRVDWSKNLSTDNYDFDTLSMMGIYGGINYEPLDYYVNDPASEDAPHFDPENGYLDVTNKAFAKPQLVDLSMWGISAFPACMFDPDVSGGGAPTTQCSPVELTIRQSFKKVTETDFEPQDWDGNRFQAFGAFTTDRMGYARNYGMTDLNWHRFIARYNIWDRHHFYSDPAKMKGEVACYTPTTTPAGADPHRDLDNDGTEDECAQVGNGSRCDTFKQRCTLPYAQRATKTLAWYYTSGSNQEFFDATRDATHEWDVALRSAVRTAQWAECKRIGRADCDVAFPVYHGQQDENDDAVALAREVDDCREGRAYQGHPKCEDVADEVGSARGYSDGVISLAKMPEMIVLCHSPVQQKDPAACGPKEQRLPADWSAQRCADGLASGDTTVRTEAHTVCDAAITARMGDLRFHQINSLIAPQTPSPWGIMTDANDPLTGEVVSASVNVWTHVNDLWSQGIVDLARYVKGELLTADVTEGTYVKDWATAAAATTQGGALPRLTVDNRDKLLADLIGGDAVTLAKARMQLKNDKTLQAQAKRLVEMGKQVKADALAPTNTRAIYDSRRKRALNSPTEAALVTKMFQSFAGGSAKFGSDVTMQFASPLRQANPSVMREMRQMKEMALSQQGACVMNEAPAPFGVAVLADVLEAKFGKFDKTQSKADQLARASKIQKYLAQRAQYAVISHEMGHSIGLRHNFVSSSDAFNYRPQYWQLRTDNGANHNACSTLVADGSCVGPRYFDPVNDVERMNLIPMFMQSTTMDYAGEPTQDMLALGAYDFAAARMFYGDVAAVYKDASYNASEPRGVGVLSKMDNFGGIIGFRPSIGSGDPQDPSATTNLHYSQLQENYDLIYGCQKVDPAKFRPAGWDESRLGTWHPLLDGLIVSMNGEYSRCHQQPVDYVQWTELRDATDAESSSPPVHAIDPQGRTRVPYGFATDRWADLGNLSVYRHDNGADAYEIFDFLITQQEVNHIFDNYRRNRQTFSVRNASNRTLSRYNEKLRDAAKGLGLMANVYRDFALESGYDYTSLWPVIGTEFFADNLLASGLGFDHFAKQMARPEAGPHELKSIHGSPVLTSTLDTAGNAGKSVMTVPNGATGYYKNVSYGGRPMENALATNKGEYNSEYVINCGTYYDKAYTAIMFTESVDNFISASRRDFLDPRYRAVSIADVFPEGYRRWLANNLTGDFDIKSPRVAAAAGKPLVDADQFPTQSFGWTNWWKESPESCFQQAQTLLCSSQPAASLPVDPEISFEQQRFLIAYTLLYLPENKQQWWLNQMNIWEKGSDSDPGFENRIELHLPDGKQYIAKRFGTETIFGKKVEKGISARMLEWGNQLLVKAYETTPGPDNDNDGQPDWYEPKLTNGQPRVKWDSSMKFIDAQGALQATQPGCNSTDNSTCPCTANAACAELVRYEEVPFFMRQAMHDYGLADPTMRGVY